MEMKESVKKLGFAVPTSISLAGYLLVRSGIEDGITTRKGFSKVATGRGLDLLDGFIARLMGWSTSFGKLADAALDKKATQEMHDAVVAEGLAPEVYDNAIVAQQTTIMAASGLTRVLHPKRTMTRSKEGAHAMAGTGLTLGGYAAAEVVREEHPQMADMLRRGSHALGAVSIFHYGARASHDYVQNIFRSEPI